MATIYLVRHGQASFGASNYDCLSDLGHTQSRILGDYFRRIGVCPDRLVSGTLSRQIDTLAGLNLQGTAERNECFNEFDFKEILKATHGNQVEAQIIKSPRVFQDKLASAVWAWQSDSVRGSFETWDEFKQRVEAGFEAACRPGANCIAVVTSGGVIAHLLTKYMGSPAAKMSDVNLVIKNASYTKFLFSGERVTISEFNNTAHLDIEPDLVSYA